MWHDGRMVNAHSIRRRSRLVSVSGFVALTMLVSACSQDGTADVQQLTDSTISNMASPTDPIATSPPTSSADRDVPEAGIPQTEVVNIFIDLADEGSQVIPVPLGSPVKIRVRRSIEDEFHLHGYDLELTGTDVQFSFTADRLGEFLLEAHNSGEQILTLSVFED